MQPSRRPRRKPGGPAPRLSDTVRKSGFPSDTNSTRAAFGCPASPDARTFRHEASSLARERSSSAKKSCFLFVDQLPFELRPRASLVRGLAGHEREELLFGRDQPSRDFASRIGVSRTVPTPL